RWKQVRFGPSSTHVFASRRSSSIEPRTSQLPRLNPNSLFPPSTSPLPRRTMANGIPRRPLPDLPTPISSVNSTSPGSNDEALDRRVAEIKSQSGRIVIMNVVYQASKDNLKRIGELGSGTCGVVYKARFDLTGTIMAVKLDRRVAEIKSQSGRIVIMNVVYQASKDNLKRIGELGSGTCGVVYKARFDLTGTIMAVKQMAITSVAEERRRVVMDLDVVLRSHDCPHIVRCYGCFISDVSVLPFLHLHLINND
ncbi:Dual specificity mitogen-activated protein kinase kinase 7, partial [Toxocara canis]